MIVSVLGAGADTPFPPLTVADTVTVLSRASTVLFTAVMVTVPVLDVWPVSIVSVVPVSVKSAAVAGATGVASTVTVTGALDDPLRVAVTVLASPFSEIDTGSSDSVTVGAPSSSTIVSVRAAGAVTPFPPVTVPITSTVLFGLSIVLFAAVTVTVPVLSVRPAAIVSVVPVRVKSVAAAGTTAVAETVTVTVSLDVPLSVAVTVLSPSSSPIDTRSSANVTTGSASSSRIVSVCFAGAATPFPPATVAVTSTDLSGASTVLFTAAIVTVPVLTVPPGSIVSVVPVCWKSLVVAGPTGAAETVTVTRSLVGRSRDAVTVLMPPFSPMDASSSARVTSGSASSSVIVSVRDAGGANPLPPVTDAVTWTVLFGASTSLLTAVTITVPVLSVCPAVIVSFRLPLNVKSLATAGSTAVADTVTTTSALDSPFNEAVTVLTPRFSLMDVRSSASVTVGVASSSLIVRVRAAGAAAPFPPVTVALTVTRLSDASMLLSSAVTVTVPLLSVWPAAIVSVAPASVKSVASAGATGAAVTVTVTFSLDGPLSVAVTVLLPPSSGIDAGSSTSVTVGAPSSSVIVSVCDAGAASPVGPDVTVADTVTSLATASTSLSSAVIVTVPVLDV